MVYVGRTRNYIYIFQPLFAARETCELSRIRLFVHRTPTIYVRDNRQERLRTINIRRAEARYDLFITSNTRVRFAEKVKRLRKSLVAVPRTAITFWRLGSLYAPWLRIIIFSVPVASVLRSAAPSRGQLQERFSRGKAVSNRMYCTYNL